VRPRIASAIRKRAGATGRRPRRGQFIIPARFTCQRFSVPVNLPHFHELVWTCGKENPDVVLDAPRRSRVGDVCARGCRSICAQGDRGTITGTAVDQSGARMAGVSVTATNTATAVSTKTLTGAGRDFTIPLLRAGTYELTAEQTGFRAYRQSTIVVQVGQTVHVDIHM
jgi:hypothetical protein